MGAVTERLRLVIDATAKGAASEIRSVGDETEKASLKTRLMEGAQKRLGVESVNTGTIMKTAVAGGVAVAGAAIAKFAADGVQEFVGLAGEVRDFQRASGASAEESSRFVAVLDDMGIKSEVGSKAIFKLGREASTGGTALAEFGIEVAHNKDGTSNLTETLLNVADAYAATKDPAERAAIAQAAFGKAGKELIPVLEQGRKGLKEFFDGAAEGHQIFSQADLQSARDYELALDDLDDTLRGLKLQVGQELVPTVTDLATVLTAGVKAGDKAKSAFGGVGDAVERAINPVENAKFAIHGLTGLFGGGEEATNKYGDAQKRAQDATTNLANVTAEHGAKSKEAREAQKELANATGDLKGMQGELEGSLEKVNTKLQTHTDKLYADRQATLLAAGDKIGLGNAVADVSTGMDKLNETLVGNLVAGDTSAQATARASQAQRDLAAQVLNVTSAAAKQAVDNLGPNASSQDKMKAATEAQTGALQYLYAQFPGLREQVQGYVGDLAAVPPEKRTDFWANVGQAVTDVLTLKNAIDSIDRNITVGINVVRTGVIEGVQDAFKP